VVRHHGCRAFGPEVLDPDDGPPETEVQTILPNHELPGGLLGAQGPPEAGTRRRSGFPNTRCMDVLYSRGSCHPRLARDASTFSSSA
jgi:hypothetical protein